MNTSAVHIESVQIECPEADVLTLSGALTFATAAAAWRNAAALLDARAPNRIDLSGLREADSAGLACVLAMLARGQCKRADLQIHNAPSGLRALARVCDAERWLA